MLQVHDHAALERLLRYCARPPFAMERLRKEGAALVYRCAKQRSEPISDKRGAKTDELHLTPLELIDRIPALVHPPRTPRDFGVGTEFTTVLCGHCGGGQTCKAGAIQAPSALPVGGADRPRLRSVPAAVPEVRWADG